MKVRVTEEHIKKGVKYSIGMCPIALALGNTKQQKRPRWSVTPYYARKHGQGVYFKLPPEAKQFVVDFDNGIEGLMPFTFTINLRKPNTYQECME